MKVTVVGQSLQSEEDKMRLIDLKSEAEVVKVCAWIADVTWKLYIVFQVTSIIQAQTFPTSLSWSVIEYKVEGVRPRDRLH